MQVCQPKKVHLKTLFLVFVFLKTVCSYSQKNLQPGYIVTIKGDTLKGLIDNRDWEKNPTVIIFKKTENSENQTFSPVEIKRFVVQGEKYEGAVVDVESSPFATELLNYFPQLNYRRDTVFLETLYEGDKNLYYYKDQQGKESFYIFQHSKFELLLYKRYLKDIAEGKTVVENNNSYKQQIVSYLNNCPSIVNVISTVNYNRKDLSNLFLNYYKNCSSTKTQFNKNVNRTLVETGLLAGLTLTSLKFDYTGTDEFLYLTNAGYKSSKNIAAGMFLNLVLPKNQGKWSIANELFFTSYKINGLYNDYHNEDYYTIHRTTFAYSQIRVNNMLRYKYPVNNIFLYVNAGITNAYAISETNNQEQEIHLYAPPTNREDKGLPSTRKYEQGYVVGVGSQLKKYSIDIRIEKGNGMSKYQSLSSSTTRLYFLIGYRF